jgi:hypothetical protein
LAKTRRLRSAARSELGVTAERGVPADVVRRGLLSSASREELGDAPVHQLATRLRDPEVDGLLHELVLEDVAAGGAGRSAQEGVALEQAEAPQ